MYHSNIWSSNIVSAGISRSDNFSKTESCHENQLCPRVTENYANLIHLVLLLLLEIWVVKECIIIWRVIPNVFYRKKSLLSGTKKSPPPGTKTSTLLGTKKSPLLGTKKSSLTGTKKSPLMGTKKSPLRVRVRECFRNLFPCTCG